MKRVSLWPHFETDSWQPFFLCCFVFRKTIDTAQCKSYRNQHHLCLEWFPVSLVSSMLFMLPLIFSPKKKGLISRTKEARPPLLNINRSWHFSTLSIFPCNTGTNGTWTLYSVAHTVPPQWPNSVPKLRWIVRHTFTCLIFFLNFFLFICREINKMLENVLFLFYL